jgi:4-hydroxybenzoate polyprenyltransferase
MMTYLKQAARIIRWWDWGPGKIALLCTVCFYIAVDYTVPFSRFILPFILFLLFAAAQAALGFVVNNWGDQELDKQQEKPNPFNEVSRQRGLQTVGTMVAIAVTTAIPVLHRTPAFLLWVIWLVTMVAYSLRPLRLKTRGLPGLVVSFIAQWSLPVLLAFTVLIGFGGKDMWLIAVALTVSGATLEIAHQRHDNLLDASSGAHTFGASISVKKLDRVYGIAVLLDKVAVGVLVALVVTSLFSKNSWWSILLAAIVGLIYSMLFFITLPQAIKACSDGTIQDPYYSQNRTSATLLHTTISNFFLPLVLILVLCALDIFYISILMIFIFWRMVLGNVEWRLPWRWMKRRRAN